MDAVSAKSCDGGGGGAAAVGPDAGGPGARLGVGFFGLREENGFLSDSGGTDGDSGAVSSGGSLVPSASVIFTLVPVWPRTTSGDKTANGLCVSERLAGGPSFMKLSFWGIQERKAKLTAALLSLHRPALLARHANSAMPTPPPSDAVSPARCLLAPAPVKADSPCVRSPRRAASDHSRSW